MFSMSIRPEILKNIREKYPLLRWWNFTTSTGTSLRVQKAGYWRSTTRARFTASSRTVYRSEPSGGLTS